MTNGGRGGGGGGSRNGGTCGKFGGDGRGGEGEGDGGNWLVNTKGATTLPLLPPLPKVSVWSSSKVPPDVVAYLNVIGQPPPRLDPMRSWYIGWFLYGPKGGLVVVDFTPRT